METKRSNKTFYIVLALLAVGLVGMTVHRNAAYKKHIADLAPSSVIGQGKPVLLNIGAAWCTYCRQMGPDLQALSAEYADRFTIAYADADKNPELMTQHNLSGIPAQIYYDAEGAVLAKHSGYASKDQILAQWNQLGIQTAPSANDQE